MAGGPIVHHGAQADVHDGVPAAQPSRLRRFEALLDRLKNNRTFVLALMVPNAIGIVFGYYYYFEAGQFDPSSRYFRSVGWWPFVSDSPNAVLVMSVALLLWTFGRRRSRILDAFAFTMMLYVGLWTTFLFLAYAQDMGTFDFPGVLHGHNNPLLFVSHMGMPLEALLLAPRLRRDAPSWGVAGLAVAWNLLNVALDYAGPHLHPAPFLHDRARCEAPQAAHLVPPASSPCDTLLHAGSFALMAATLAAFVLLVAPWRQRQTSDPPSQDEPSG